MRRLPTFDEPRFLVLVVLVLVMAGLSSILTLGRQEDPTITNIYATIKTRLPGADPARIEAEITKELETELREIAEIAEIESLSLKGISIINVALDETMSDVGIPRVWTRLRSAVDDALPRLPADALPPEIDTEGITAYSTVIGLTLDHPGTNPTAALRLADHIADQLRNVPETRVVRLFGAPDEEVLVSVDPVASAALGITVSQIAGRIAAGDGKVLAGHLPSPETDTNLSVSGEVVGLDRIRAIPLREGMPGKGLVVADVANVSRGAALPPAGLALADGKPAILIAALVKDGAQIDRWMGQVRDRLDTARQVMPAGMSLKLLFDQSAYTVDRLTQLALSLLQGTVIVILVLIVTLGWRAAAVVALILPLVSLATLASLSAIGLPLHQMTMAGLIAALGLVVDAAIVMTHEVRRNLLEGRARAEAARLAIGRLMVPLAASTLTTILAFAPMMVLPGPTGDFVSAIAISVAVMLVWSFVLAIFVTSAISARFLSAAHHARARAPGLWSRAMVHGLRYPSLMLLVSLILPLMGLWFAPTLTPQFFPVEYRNQFHLELELPGHSSIARTEQVVRRVDAVLRGKPGVGSVYWGIGESAPSFYYNLIGSRSDEAYFAQAMVTTDDAETAAHLSEQLQQELDYAFPEARVIVRVLTQGPPVDAPVEFRLVGPDLGRLTELGESLKAVLRQQQAITHVRSTMSRGLPQIRFDIDSVRARMVGLNEVAIAGQLNAGLAGQIATTMVERAEQIPIRVRVNEATRGNADRIRDFPLVAMDADGMPSVVPLSSLGDMRLEVAESAIHRRDAERINLVQAFTRAGILSEQATRDALAAIQRSDVAIPAGYRLELGGDASERSDAVRNLIASLGLIVTLTLATAVVTFRSFRLTIGAVLVSGLAAGLSILSLKIMDFPFGINAMVGMIGSIGVSINAAIIIFTALQGNNAAARGDRAAGAQEVAAAAPHIISTTLTTFGGFIPLFLTGGLFWPPFAVAIAGGVLLSATLAFLFSPAFFFMFYAPRPQKPRAPAR